MYACGLRISEAASLEVTAIDGLNGLIRVIGKGNKERCVPLPTAVLAELRRLWKAHGNRLWVVPQSEG
jgi:integrase/recombinase XerD